MYLYVTHFIYCLTHLSDRKLQMSLQILWYEMPTCDIHFIRCARDTHHRVIWCIARHLNKQVWVFTWMILWRTRPHYRQQLATRSGPALLLTSYHSRQMYNSLHICFKTVLAIMNDTVELCTLFTNRCKVCSSESRISITRKKRWLHSSSIDL